MSYPLLRLLKFYWTVILKNNTHQSHNYIQRLKPWAMVKSLIIFFLIQRLKPLAMVHFCLNKNTSGGYTI